MVGEPAGGYAAAMAAVGRRIEPLIVKQTAMLYTLALILVIAWLLGLVSAYTMNGFIHILLVVAIIVVLVRIIQGKRID